MNEVNYKLADTWDSIVREEQKIHGGETPLDVYAGSLERAARALRCYGRDAGLALLLGRLVTMFQNSPRAAGQFALALSESREISLLGFLREANPHAAALGKLGGSAKSPLPTKGP